LVFNPEDYVYSSAANYTGGKGLIEVTTLTINGYCMWFESKRNGNGTDYTSAGSAQANPR